MSIKGCRQKGTNYNLTGTRFFHHFQVMESAFEFLYTKTCSLLKYVILSEAYAKLSNVHALNNTQTAILFQHAIFLGGQTFS